jgi:hypothetical protein
LEGTLPNVLEITFSASLICAGLQLQKTDAATRITARKEIVFFMRIKSFAAKLMIYYYLYTIIQNL